MNDSITLSHVDLEKGLLGVTGWADKRTVIERSKITNFYQSAILLGGSDGLQANYNVIKNIALIPGRVASNWTYIAVDVKRIDTDTLSMNVHHNEIINTGYIAII